MIVSLTFKTTDVVDESIRAAVMDDLSGDVKYMEEDERKAVIELRIEKLRAKAGRWFEWGEYVKIEWDTVTDECKVVRP